MVTISLTEAELQSLVGILDAGIRATGIRAVKEAAPILDKLEVAAQELKPKDNTEE